MGYRGLALLGSHASSTGRGRPWSAEASGPGAVPRLHPLQQGALGRRERELRCRQHPLALLSWGLGDQGRGKGIFFQEEQEVGVLGKGLF